MKAILGQRLFSGMLPAAIVLFSATTCAAFADTQHIIIDPGDNALTTEEAKERQEQWDDARNLRKKVNERLEYNFDKHNRVKDLEERCLNSENIHAYWENTTSRCLDRRTGGAIIVP